MMGAIRSGPGPKSRVSTYERYQLLTQEPEFAIQPLLGFPTQSVRISPLQKLLPVSQMAYKSSNSSRFGLGTCNNLEYILNEGVKDRYKAALPQCQLKCETILSIFSMNHSHIKP